jgi:hypothetical protein
MRRLRLGLQICALLAAAGVVAIVFHLRDDRDRIDEAYRTGKFVGVTESSKYMQFFIRRPRPPAGSIDWVADSANSAFDYRISSTLTADLADMDVKEDGSCRYQFDSAAVRRLSLLR